MEIKNKGGRPIITPIAGDSYGYLTLTGKYKIMGRSDGRRRLFAQYLCKCGEKGYRSLTDIRAQSKLHDFLCCGSACNARWKKSIEINVGDALSFHRLMASINIGNGE